ncbi:MAG: AgmX/PglI C-terminal domain-containing protein [Proteobacteria bacterium]|nr:AgmX/PglI C-terminal domain-containing protein [Pseudomonadota bacterium]
MRYGFEVNLKKGNWYRVFTIEDREISIGNAYTNNIPINVDFDTFKLLELEKDILKLYWNRNFKIELVRNGERKDLNDLLGFVEVKEFIQLKKDIEVFVLIGEYEFYLKVVPIEEKHIVYVPKNFHEDVITKENVGFLSLVMAITFLAFFGVSNIIRITPDLAFVEFKDESKVFDMSYKRVETQNKDKAQIKRSDESSGKREEKTSVKAAGKSGKGGGYFEGEAVVSKGVLAVEEGTKNVLIEKERSLFAKIDESIKTKPVKGYQELTNVTGQVFDTPRRFDTAKIDEIRGGNLVKNVETKAIELDRPEKIRTDLYTKNVQVLKGKRPEGEIISVISKHKKGFEFLYIEERKKDPTLQGRLVVKIEITSKGDINNIEVLDTDIKNKEFIQKIIFLVKSIHFSESDYGDTVVKIPLVFLPS